MNISSVILGRSSSILLVLSLITMCSSLLGAVIEKSGTISTNETWGNENTYRITGDITIPNGVTLTIATGTSVEFSYANENDLSYDIRIQDGGALAASGASFSGSTRRYYSVDYYSTIFVQSGASATFNECILSNSDLYLSYLNGSTGSLTDDCTVNGNISLSGDAQVTISDSTISNDIVVSEGARLTADNNEFTTSIPLFAAPGFDFSGIVNNTFGTDPYIRFSGGTIGSSTTWSIRDGIDTYRITGDITIPNGVTLTIATGTSVEFSYANENDLSYDIRIQDGGALAASGASFSGSTRRYYSVDYYSTIFVQSGASATFNECDLTNSFMHVVFQNGSGGSLVYLSGYGTIFIDAGTTVAATNNDFSSTNINLTGNSSSTISLAGNYWGSVEPTDIAARIQDHSDNASLPYSVTSNPLTDKPLPPGSNNPTITVSLAQQLAGTHTVRIGFELADIDGDLCDISIEASRGAGLVYSLPNSAISGDFTNVAGGTRTISVDLAELSGSGLDLSQTFLRDVRFFLTATDPGGNQGSGASNECLIDTENPDLLEIMAEADAGLDTNGLGGLSGAYLLSEYLGLRERNIRGVFFSRGLASRSIAPLLNQYGFPAIRRVDGQEWASENFSVESPEADRNALFFFNPNIAEPWHNLPALDWEFPANDGAWSRLGGSFQNDSDYATAMQFGVPGAEEQSQLFKRFEFPRSAAALSSNQDHPTEVETDYKNLDPNARKLIILVHGWNPDGANDFYADKEFGSLADELHGTIDKYNSAYDLGWDLYAYNWASDAATGSKISGSHANLGGLGNGVENGTQAAEIGFQHGLVLGRRLKELYPSGLDSVHFIAHSAGTWVIRSASLYLEGAYTTEEEVAPPKQQITLLDPYNPTIGLRDWKFSGGETSNLNTSKIEAWPSLISITENFENIYSVDEFVPGTNEVYGGGFNNLEVGGGLGFQLELYTKWRDHGGPISYYAYTVNKNQNLIGSFESVQESALNFWKLASAVEERETTAGFKNSLFWQDVLDHDAAPDGAQYNVNGSTAAANSARNLPYELSSSGFWQSAVIDIDERWVRALLLPSDGSASLALGPSRIGPDLTFSLEGPNDLILAGSIDTSVTPSQISLTLNGQPFGSPEEEISGNSEFAGTKADVDGDGNRFHTIVLKDNTLVTSVSGVQIDGSSWGGSASGSVDGSGNFTASGSNGLTLSGGVQGGESTNVQPISFTPPDGVTMAPGNFSEWIAAHGISGSGNIGAFNDPDGDGVRNIFEFYRASLPGSADPEPLVSPMVTENNQFGLRFWRSNTASLQNTVFKWSPNLIDWADDGESIGGLRVDYELRIIDSNAAATQYEIIPISADPFTSIYMRLSIEVPEQETDYSPDLATFQGLVLGQTLPGDYMITSTSRFSWFGEQGNWSYVKTGTDTATLVFTYDTDGNNPGVYREQIDLTFTSASDGTAMYSEYNSGALDSGSIENLPFSLDFATGFAPDTPTFQSTVLGQTLQGNYQINSATRFSWFGEQGNWSYTKTGANTATLMFVYDSEGNDPALYREQIEITFSSESGGTAVYGEHNLGLLDSGSVQNSPFSIVFTEGFAPDVATFQTTVVGQTLEGDYQITSATRFSWFGEQGNWNYAKTGADTGVLVFTYDSNGNDPGAYRELIDLTFTSASGGTAMYSEYNSGALDSGSIENRPFSLDFATGFAPDTPTFQSTVLGQTLQGNYQINSATRFSWFGEQGNWSYTKTGANTATLMFVYDSEGNDPELYREQIEITFTSESGGTAEYGEYNLGLLDSGSVQNGPFSIVFTEGFAPDVATFQTTVVGETLEGDYQIISATRFSWFGEQGNWSYAKTGADTGVLVFTYDSDGNDPSVYREQIDITFTSESEGNAVYGEYNNGQLNPFSLQNRPFSLVFAASFAPDAATFQAFVLGKTLQGNYQIISPTRFSWFGEQGNWSYTKTGDNTATLVFTYDYEGNNPNVYREQIELTFTSESGGDSVYEEYNFGTLNPFSVQYGPFSLP
ncbi:MAG: hypothetical protein ACSHX9_11150 [Luteolibacter sp.]